MNWKHLISAILLLVLVPVSAFGLSCEVTCGLASMMAYHQLSRSAGAKASTSMEMSQMDCDSMRQEHRTTVSRVLPDCVLTSQSCDEGACASDSSWLTEQKSLIDHPELTWSSALDAAVPSSGTSVITPLSFRTFLPPPSHRSFTVLRI